MKIIRGIDFFEGSREEQLPGFSSDFPYIATCAELDYFEGRFAPWHWHKTVELFYLKRGDLEYSTPYGNYFFPEGSGGLLNSNILHMTKPKSSKTVQLLHIFDTALISGEAGSRIEHKYIMPLTTTGQLDMIALYPNNPLQKEVLDLIKKAFDFSEQEFGYELKLREALTKIWLSILQISSLERERKNINQKVNDKIKLMMIYIHENFADKITISELAKAGYISERDCFRVFHECLHMTPTEYITNYRLQRACSMLVHSRNTITEISHKCGLGSSSYFGKVFRDHMGITPLQYRQKWQNIDT